MQQVHPCTILQGGFDSGTRYAKRSCTEVQSEFYVALDQQYITNAEFQDVYVHAGRTRSAIRGFINYLATYEQDQRKKGNPEPVNGYKD